VCGAISNGIRFKPKFVLDADIKGCFDSIDQQALLNKLHTYPKLTQQIRGWLKAGVMEGLDFTPTERGTPQGGVISPLLANVALHGLEEVAQAGVATSAAAEKPNVVRYADDFVILYSDKLVSLTRDHTLRSRVKRKFHARFWIGCEGSDPPTDHTMDSTKDYQ
jgi:RNA-directed DNA polymerase